MAQFRFLFVSLLITVVGIGQTVEDKVKLANRDKYLFGVKIENKNFVETIPFTEKNKLIFVTVQLNGGNYTFLFDTGAVTMVSKKLQTQLGLQEVMRNNLVDGSGKEQAESFFTVEKMKLGSVTFNSVGAVAMDMDNMSQQFCTPIDGVVGANLMRSCYWKIDYKNKVLVFSDKKIKPTEKSYELPFEENFSGTPLVNLFFGNYNFQTIFDTGNNQSFNFPDSLYFKSSASKNKILRRGSGSTEFTLYGNKNIIDHASILDSVTIGTRLFQNQIVRIGPSPLPILGNRFLMQFDEVLLDWKKRIIYLPLKYHPEEPIRTLGFDPLFLNGKVIVSYIWEGSEAQKQGLN